MSCPSCYGRGWYPEPIDGDGDYLERICVCRRDFALPAKPATFVFDYVGTLDTLPEPEAFELLDGLRALGYRVVIWTATGIPWAWAERVDQIHQKGSDVAEFWDRMGAIEYPTKGNDPSAALIFVEDDPLVRNVSERLVSVGNRHLEAFHEGVLPAMLKAVRNKH